MQNKILKRELIEAPAANDDGPLRAAAPEARLAHLDDPCTEGGFDDRCRDHGGQLCPLHLELCYGPDYPCIDKLRHLLAVRFLEEIAAARARD